MRKTACLVVTVILFQQAGYAYELLIALSATPSAQLNPITGLTSTAQTVCTSNTISGGTHSVDRSFIGYFNGGKQTLTTTFDASFNGTLGLGAQGFCFVANERNFAYGDYQEKRVRTYQFPEGVLTLTGTCDETAGIQEQTAGALTPDPSDAEIAESNIKGTLGKVTDFFRNIPLGTATFDLQLGQGSGVSFIPEASPLGEVFFATPDLSVVIHEPLPGGMPKVIIPSNVVKLLAAIWL